MTLGRCHAAPSPSTHTTDCVFIQNSLIGTSISSISPPTPPGAPLPLMYRGPIIPLRGQYVFSDYCSGEIYIVGAPGAGAWSFDTLAGTPSMNTYGFGEDASGNLYVADQAGEIYRFHSASGTDLIFANGFD